MVDVWVFELNGPGTDDDDDTEIGGPGPSLNPTTLPIAASSPSPFPYPGISNGEFFIVAVEVNDAGGTITGITDPSWTLDVVQRGNAVAYKFADGTQDEQVAFINNANTTYFALGADYFTVNAGASCLLSVVPSILSFTATVGGNSPPPQNVTVSNVGAGGSVPVSFTSNQAWLLPSSGSGNTPDTISVSVNIGGLAAGTYTGQLTFTSTCGSPNVTVTITLVVAPVQTTCAPVDGNGVPIDGVYIDDLNLYVIPSAALYTQPVPNAAISVNEDYSQGRNQVILDFNNSEGLYVRDLGTIFTWSIQNPTILDVWQPSIIPMDDDVYNRMSFHFLMSSGGMVGWGHLREVNLAFQSMKDLTLLLTFDQWPPITLTIPNSGGNEVKMKVVIPPNKFKLIEGFLSCPTSFKLWASDVQFKIGQWGRKGAYAVTKPLVG